MKDREEEKEEDKKRWQQPNDFLDIFYSEFISSYSIYSSLAFLLIHLRYTRARIVRLWENQNVINI